MTNFYVELDLNASNGQIRMEFFGQDVLYHVKPLRVEQTVVVGTAELAESSTGEVRGTSFEFQYDFQDKTLRDGSALAFCENLQDPSLMELRNPTPEV